jgi:hypothetical protein
MFDGGVTHYLKLLFWTLSSESFKNTTFRKFILFPLATRGFDFAPHSPEDGNRSSLRNVVILKRTRMMDEVQKVLIHFSIF